MSYLFCGPVENGRTSSDLVVLFDDGGSPPLGNQRSQLGLPWQFDDVPVEEQPCQEVLDLISLLWAAHVEHEDPCLGLLVRLRSRLSRSALEAGIPDASDWSQRRTRVTHRKHRYPWKKLTCLNRSDSEIPHGRHSHKVLG